jgi:glutaredoxin-related protein
MKNKIKLLPEHIKFLEDLPEEGMGYQLVDIELKSGKKLKRRIVLNSTFLQLDENEHLDLNDIRNIRVYKP